jgi:hypothetical protein
MAGADRLGIDTLPTSDILSTSKGTSWYFIIRAGESAIPDGWLI